MCKNAWAGKGPYDSILDTRINVFDEILVIVRGREGILARGWPVRVSVFHIPERG
jgi:hypothetical protein